MKMLMIILLMRAVMAYVDSSLSKRKKVFRDKADTLKVQHPAETMLR